MADRPRTIVLETTEKGCHEDASRKPRSNGCVQCGIWEKAYGPVPLGMCVYRFCGNRRCVNPEHLILRAPKGRCCDFEKEGNEEEVDRLYRRTGKRNNMPALAIKFNVSESCVYRIVNRGKWKNIERCARGLPEC